MVSAPRGRSEEDCTGSGTTNAVARWRPMVASMTRAAKGPPRCRPLPPSTRSRRTMAAMFAAVHGSGHGQRTRVHRKDRTTWSASVSSAWPSNHWQKAQGGGGGVNGTTPAPLHSMVHHADPPGCPRWMPR